MEVRWTGRIVGPHQQNFNNRSITSGTPSAAVVLQAVQLDGLVLQLGTFFIQSTSHRYFQYHLSSNFLKATNRVSRVLQ